MSDPNDDSRFEKLGLSRLVASGDNAVVILDKLLKEFNNFPRKDVASLGKWMSIWCDGNLHLPPERFKMLGKFGMFENFGGYRIDEFKSYQSRAYGTVATNWRGRTFVVTALAIKKTDDADPAILRRAARLAAELNLET